MAPPTAKASIKGNERVDPEMAVFIKLDDLSRILQKEFKAQRDVMVQLLNTTILNQEHLKAIRQAPQGVAPIPLVQKMEEIRVEINDLISEVADRRDQGEYRIYKDTANTTDFDLDLIKDYGFPVKGYILSNDGDNTIEIGHMSEDYLLDVSPERFYPVYPDDAPWEVMYDLKQRQGEGIRRIILRTTTGTSKYRLWLFW
jgi:hypothetical protein